MKSLLKVSIQVSIGSVLDERSFDFHIIVLTGLEEGKFKVWNGDKIDFKIKCLLHTFVGCKFVLQCS